MSSGSVFCEAFAQALSAGSVEPVLGFFLIDRPEISCLFGTQEGWARGPAQVRSAVHRFVHSSSPVEVRFADVQTHTIGAVSHIISGSIHYNWTEADEALSRTSRFNMIAQPDQDGLKCLHFAEAPIAPLIELQQYYQAMGREGHPS